MQIFRGVRSVRQSRAAASPRSRERAQNDQLYYLGTAGGGVWKSENGGATWQPVFEKQGVSAIGAVAIDPTNERRRLGRYRRGESAQQRQLRRRSLQVDRRRRRPGRRVGLEGVWSISRIAIDPHEFTPRRRRCIRRSVQRFGQSRRLRNVRRRRELAEVALSFAVERRERYRDGSPEPQRRLCRHVALSARAVDLYQRRPRRRSLQIDRRRPHVEEADRQRPSARDIPAASAWRSHRAGRIASLRSSKRRAGFSGEPTTPARTGR